MNMVSGLFRGHPIYQPPSQAAIDAALDELAGYLETDNHGWPEIARRMNVTGGTVAVLYRQLCLRYGEPVA